jgi:transforming growth factor-beta-induced protein
MTPNRMTRTALAGLAALALLGAACSDDDATTTSAGADTTEESADSTTETTNDAGNTDDNAGGSDTAMGEPVGDACAAIPADGEGSSAGMADDPVATAASNNPVLSTLVTAVTEAGLVDTLNTGGPFTVFAPSNDAFAKIDPATLDAVLADKDLLTQILTLHVVPAEELDAGALAELSTLPTVNGQEISIDAQEEEITVNGQAKVICANVETANATVHIIDTVLMPEGM